MNRKRTSSENRQGDAFRIVTRGPRPRRGGGCRNLPNVAGANSNRQAFRNRRNHQVHRDRYPGFDGFDARTVVALQEEQATLNLYLNGKVEQIWLREDGKGVVFIMAAITRGEAADLLQKLPYAQANAIKFDLIPVGPMMSLLDDAWLTGHDGRVAQIYGDLMRNWFGQRLRREYTPRY